MEETILNYSPTVMFRIGHPVKHKRNKLGGFQQYHIHLTFFFCIIGGGTVYLSKILDFSPVRPLHC